MGARILGGTLWVLHAVARNWESGFISIFYADARRARVHQSAY
ncbi:hypothetical protein FM101_11145 [Arthrobacter rhombi]|uniref:Uncharacterized protein n=1 Tax=Arthrobacter rhombi TaxID=71253 RepID=A0A1R4GKC0_9MICC|nr:hypothetical protein FM101_11145 [Arthrobacter rhombi]